MERVRVSFWPTNITANPFKPEPIGLALIIKYMLLEHIQIAVQDINFYTCNGSHLKLSLEKWIEKKFIWLTGFGEAGLFTSAHNSDDLQIHATDFYLATCDGNIKLLRYQFFLDPFDSFSWYACLTTMGVITGFMLAVSCCTKVSQMDLNRDRKSVV